MNANVSVRASSLATKFCLQLSEAQGLLGPATDVSYHCEIFFYAHKLGSTDLAEGPNVMWHHLLHIPMSIIKDKETINILWTTTTSAGTEPTLQLTIKEYLIIRIKMHIQ